MPSVSLTVNNQPVTVAVEGRTLLIHYLREKPPPHRHGYRLRHDAMRAPVRCRNGHAVKSCTVLAMQAQGAGIVTIEGVARTGNLHPVWRSSREKHGRQRGFCTPGMIMSAIDRLNKNPNPTEE